MFGPILAFLCLAAGSAINIDGRVHQGSESDPEPFDIVGANWTDLWWEDVRFPDNLRLNEFGKARKGSWEYLCVVPQYKLVFNLIPKCAGTQFNDLMADLAGEPVGYPFAGRTAPHRFGLSLRDLRQENGWRWAAFIRSPTARYLSAWGSKCQYGEDADMGHCICGSECRVSNTAALQARVKSFQAHLRDSKKDMDQNQGRRHRNDSHWERQAAFFELYDVPIQNYSFVGHLQGDVNGQVRRMLRMVGAPEEMADKYFPTDRIAGHHSDLGPHIQEFYRGTGNVFNELWYHEDQLLPGIAQ